MYNINNRNYESTCYFNALLYPFIAGSPGLAKEQQYMMGILSFVITLQIWTYLKGGEFSLYGTDPAWV